MMPDGMTTRVHRKTTDLRPVVFFSESPLGACRESGRSGPQTKRIAIFHSWAHQRPMMRRLFAALACLLLPVLACGCRVGGYTSAEKQNEKLRTDVRSLQSQIASLTAERDELKVKVANGPRLGEAAAALPVVVEIEIDELSALVPIDKAQPATGATIRFTPLDGRRRFVPITGSVTIRIVRGDAAVESQPKSSSKAKPKTPPIASAPTVLGERTVTPEQLREAYRSGLWGTHYSVEVPLAALLPRPLPSEKTLTATLVFKEAWSDREIKADRLILPR